LNLRSNENLHQPRHPAQNAEDLNIPFHQELLRVMAHGVLHLCGLKDKTKEEQMKMREEEEQCMNDFVG
jgi:probable rRNA maturation factor